MLIGESDYNRLRAEGKLTEKNGQPAVMVTSRPVVSTGFVEIDAANIGPEYLNRDISVVQGRADTVADHAKESVKVHQALNNGEIVNKLAVSEATPPFAGKDVEMESFNVLERGPLDNLIVNHLLASSESKQQSLIDYLLADGLALSNTDIYMAGELLETGVDLSSDQVQKIVNRLLDVYVPESLPANTENLIKEVLDNVVSNNDLMDIIKTNTVLLDRLNSVVDISSSVEEVVVAESISADVSTEVQSGIESLLAERNESSISQVLPRFSDNPTLESARDFVMEYMTNPEGRRNDVAFHNEHHLAEIFAFAENILDNIELQDQSRSPYLMKMAIYFSDLGFFQPSPEGTPLNNGHEQRSIGLLNEFVNKMKT